jgi:hypothetical protein
MQSKNKKSPTVLEREHITRIKEMDCVVCGASGPSECHEIEQGQWFTSMPLCPSCHRNEVLGIHGQKRMWAIHKLDELSALNKTIGILFSEK